MRYKIEIRNRDYYEVEISADSESNIYALSPDELVKYITTSNWRDNFLEITSVQEVKS